MGILNMKRMLLLLAFIAPVMVCAEPSSQIAWTPEVLNLVKKGNADKGKVLAESCKSCHGDKGQGMKEETRDGVWRQLSCPVRVNYPGRFLLKNQHTLGAT